MKRTLLSLVSMLAAAGANAAIISGDFRNESDLPYCCDRSGPMVMEALGKAVGAGTELNGTASFSNPSGWYGGIVYVDLDPSTNILTLLSQDGLDFQTFSSAISNIQFSASEVIVGISMLTNNLTTLGVVPTLSFTNDSLLINYDTQSIFNFTGSTASFQIHTSNVPEPASLALLGIGLVGLGAMRRRKAA